MSIQELQVIACHYLFINKTTANNPQKENKTHDNCLLRTSIQNIIKD